jgi:transposase InsO family protein
MRYGYPTWLTKDNGTEFGVLLRHQLDRLGINHITTSALHPQSNGAAERLVRTVRTILVPKVDSGHHDWPASHGVRATSSYDHGLLSQLPRARVCSCIAVGIGYI